jgi:hypothetical protein
MEEKCREGYKLVRKGLKWVCRRILPGVANAMNAHNIFLNAGNELAERELHSQKDAQNVQTELDGLEAERDSGVIGAAETLVQYYRRQAELSAAASAAARAADAANQAREIAAAHTAAAAAAAIARDPESERAAREARFIQLQQAADAATATYNAAVARRAATQRELDTTREQCAGYRETLGAMEALLVSISTQRPSQTKNIQTKQTEASRDRAAQDVSRCNGQIALLVARCPVEDRAVQVADEGLVHARAILHRATEQHRQNIRTAADQAAVADAMSLLPRGGPRRRGSPPRGGSRKRRIQRKQRKTRRS